MNKLALFFLSITFILVIVFSVTLILRYDTNKYYYASDTAKNDGAKDSVLSSAVQDNAQNASTLSTSGQDNVNITIHSNSELPTDPSMLHDSATSIDSQKFKIYVVLDDAGVNVEEIKKFDNFKGNFTVAIIPHLEASTQVAEYLAGKNISFLLHIPMEPEGEYSSDNVVKILSMSTNQEILKSDIAYYLSDVTGYIGINNHMGSRATADPAFVQVLLQELSPYKESILILDSRTSKYTKLYDMAKEQNFNALNRDVFIDNYDDLLYIKNQIRIAINIGLEKKSVVVIGHVTKQHTSQALIEMYDEVLSQGGVFYSLRNYKPVEKIKLKEQGSADYDKANTTDIKRKSS